MSSRTEEFLDNTNTWGLGPAITDGHDVKENQTKVLWAKWNQLYFPILILLAAVQM